MAYFLLTQQQNIIMMKKAEIFDKVLSIVEEETETSRVQILSGAKKEEVIDARALLIFTLHEMGFYPTQIAALSGICPRCVTPFIQSFKDRKSSKIMLGIYYENVRRKLRESMD